MGHQKTGVGLPDTGDPQVALFSCETAARDAFEFMRRRYPGSSPLYHDSKWHTILAGGGHEYTYFKKYNRWKK